MKKYLFAFVAGIIPTLVTINGATAQSLGNTNAMENDMASVVKRPSANDENSTAFFKTDLSDVNAKAIKNFAKNHKNVTGESWDKTTEGFRAKYVANGTTNMVFYSSKGNWQGSMKTYGEAQLDRNVRAIVKREYYDYNIVLVQEIETLESDKNPTYVVHVEDQSNYKMLLIHDGDMQIYDQFQKQK